MVDPKSSLPPEEVTPLPATPDEGETLDGAGSTSVTPSAKVALGSTFAKGQILAGRFRVLRFVARGGMGEVYEAEDLELNERVALKSVRFEMAENERTIERFKREIQLARKVTHPSVCRTFDVFRHVEPAAEGTGRETLIVSMEFLRGTTLSQRIALNGRLTTEFALPIVEQLAAGLEAAHAAGVIHRDFKSPNVLLVPAAGSPGGVRVVITDFGLAHAISGDMASLTGSLDVVGTPAYMAPEQLEGNQITAATDTYALGIVMFEMLTGAVPFAGSTVISTALRRLKEPAPSPKSVVFDLDPLWEAVVLRCLEREPERRFASTSDVAKALHGDAVSTPAPSPRSARKRFYLPVAIFAMFVLAAVVAYVAIEKATTTVTSIATTPAPATASKARTSVAILGFQNLSGQPGANLLGEVLADSLWSQLDVDELRFIPPSRVDEMRRDLDIKEVKADPGKNDLRRIAQYLGGEYAVTGSYRVQGEKNSAALDWNIHLVRAVDNQSIASIHESGSPSQASELATRVGKLLRTKLGVTLTAQEESRLDNSLSTNPEALARFAEGTEKLRKFDLLGGINVLQSSLAADPNFVRARATLAGAWSDLGFESKAQEEAKKALDLSTNLSAEGKGLVAGRYYEAMHDWPRAIEQYSSLWTLYGDNPEYGLLLALNQTSGGKADQALSTLTQVRKQNLPTQLEARVDLAEAEAHEELSEFDKQLAAATTAAAKADKSNARSLLARARIQQCGALLNSGKGNDAKPICEEAQKLNVALGDTLGAARATNEVANAYWRSGDSATAKPLYEQALGMAQTIGDKRDEAGALNNLANIRHAQGDAAGAVRDYLRSIATANERGSLGDAALSQQMLGVIYYEQGKNKEGEAAFQQAILTARQIGDRKTESRALINRCSARLNVGELKAARRDCEQSLQLRRAMDDQTAIAGALGATGDVDHAEGDLPEAERNYTEALRIQEQLRQKPDAATSRVFLAMLALENGNPKEAQTLAQEATAEFADEKDGASESAARAMLAEALLAQGNVSGSQSALAGAKHLSEAAGDRSLRSRIALVQAKIDLQSGNPDAVIRTLKDLEKDSRSNGELADALEFRVTLGQAQLKAGHMAEARSTLGSVAREAQSKGFALLAAKAKLALAGKAPN